MPSTIHSSKNTSSFNSILQEASNWFQALSESKQKTLKDNLDHGIANLTNKKQLKAYLHCYGKIHQAKILHALSNIPDNLWLEGQISIIDYGCGQGIAEMVLSDFIASKPISNIAVRDITLIDPSKANLFQAIEHLKLFFSNTTLTQICKSDDQITQNDISPQSRNVIHILSNVVDIPEFDGRIIAKILSNDTTHKNYVICVSPFYQENGRGRKMYDFGSLLHGYSLVYKFEKHVEDWDKSYSCQIHIYVSAYF